MKKFFSIIALSAMTLSLSSFKSDKVPEDEVFNTGCFTAAGYGAGVIAAMTDLNYYQEFLVWEVLYNECLEQNP
jgi:hypothetical protein